MNDNICMLLKCTDTEHSYLKTTNKNILNIKIDYSLYVVTSPPPSVTGGRVHAFEFNELGGLCRTLRQICLGLVELAYPESRPAVTGQYRDAVAASHIDVSGKNETPAWSHLFKVTI